MKITIIVGTIVLVIGVIVAAAWIKLRSSLNDAPAAILVRIEPAQRGELDETINAPGEVQPKTKVSISARVSARIIALPYLPGQTVTSGNPLAKPPVPASILVKLDSTDLEAALKQAQANYAAQQASIAQAKAQYEAQQASIRETKVTLADYERDLGRQKQLLSTYDVAQSVVDAAQTKVDQTKAQLTAAEMNLQADKAGLLMQQHQSDAADAQITRAKDDLSYTTILSPIDGTVTRVNAEVGELVVMGTMNNAGTVIMEVADLSKMLVNARIEEADIARVKPGQKAKIRMLAYPDQVFTGTVQTVALAETKETDGTRDYQAQIQLDTTGKRIPSGLSADVEIETARHHNVLRIPSQAVLGRTIDSLAPELQNRPEIDHTKTMQTVVFTIKDGKAYPVPVKIGASDLTNTIIKSGLTAGEPIIIGPYKILETIANGQSVKFETPTTKPSTTKPATHPATKPTTHPGSATVSGAPSPSPGTPGEGKGRTHPSTQPAS